MSTYGIFTRTFTWIVVVALIPEKDPVTATLGTPEQRLRDDLFPKQYHSNVRPVLQPNDTVNVSFSYRLARIVSLDIKAQVLTTDAWIVQVWKNPYLIWNESKYDGVDTLQMSTYDIWVPDIVLYNNADEGVTLSGFTEKFKTNVIVNSDGVNTWMSPATFKSSCGMAVRFYPFDRQNCEMTFGSWTFDSRLVKMVSRDKEHTKSAVFVESGDWDLKDITTKTADKTYECCRQPFSDITYTLHFQRKSLYHVVYQILPCIVITLLVMLNFIIPPDSGERISFCITLLLAMSVYLLILTNSLPETSDDFAILGVYYMVTIVVIAFSLAGTVVVLRCQFADDRPSEGLLKFAKFVLRRKENVAGNNKVCLQASENKAISEESRIETSEIETEPDDKSSEDPAIVLIAQSIKEQKEKESWKDSWKEIAKAVDRILLFVFVITTAIVTAVTWIHRP